MARAGRFLLVLAALLLACAPFAASAGPIPLETSTRLAEATGAATILRDPTGRLDAAQAGRLEQEGRFQPVRRNPALGYTPDTLWLAIPVERRPGAPAEWLLEVQPAYLDDVRLHLPDGRVLRGGDALPVSQRAWHAGSLFPLTLPEGESRLLLQVRTTSTLAVVPRIWSPAGFEQDRARIQTLYGAFFGLMLAVVLFNVLNGLLTGRRLCHLYALYALSSAASWWGILGFLGLYWLPEAPAAANLAVPLAITLNAALAATFYYQVLDIRHFPLVRRFYQGFILLSLATLVAALLGHYQTLAPWLFFAVLIWVPVTLPPVLRAWRSGRGESRVAAIAFCAFSLLTVINAITLIGVIDACMWSLVWAGQIANLAHILLLHVAVLLGLRRTDEERLNADIQAAEARRDARRQREYAEEQGRFLAMITHEIRTPISVIAAASESLRVLDSDAAPPRLARYEKIAGAVRRLSQLVDLLLARGDEPMATVEAGGLEKTPTDLLSLTQEIVARQPEERERLRVSAPAVLPLVPADVLRLRFVFINLIENALKYSKPGTPIDIRLAPHLEPGFPMEVEWRITNRGERIPDGERERIFDKHARLSETAGKPGLGLGLYLARHIVDLHDGRIFVDPHVTDGASFVVWLPSTHSEP